MFYPTTEKYLNTPLHLSPSNMNTLKISVLSKTTFPSANSSGSALYCPGGNSGDCIISVWSTPRKAEDHAKQIKRKVMHCEHRKS